MINDAGGLTYWEPIKGCVSKQIKIELQKSRRTEWDKEESIINWYIKEREKFKHAKKINKTLEISKSKNKTKLEHSCYNFLNLSQTGCNFNEIVFVMLSHHWWLPYQRCGKAMVLKPRCTSESPGRLVKTQLAATHSQSFRCSMSGMEPKNVPF